PFINYHAGITPKYRGVHGGYWAQAEGDPGNFGVTVHLVDRGIDTGEVLYQERLAPSADDNYSTLPYLQLGAALPLLERAARDAVNGTLRPEKLDLPSKLWSHPTLWQYIKTGLRRGVWEKQRSAQTRGGRWGGEDAAYDRRRPAAKRRWLVRC